ncbi:hypothetical protein O6P43_028903 [Quillaja saponaria]|uniref:Uncharacterized protein n=1 Tax=Quillaja saponaria TaxID=32244 RepID=A0AAD7KZF7_QUISA|nr:hypothetical protein O6P43_028903 [Quillaja saponaria]
MPSLSSLGLRLGFSDFSIRDAIFLNRVVSSVVGQESLARKSKRALIEEAIFLKALSKKASAHKSKALNGSKWLNISEQDALMGLYRRKPYPEKAKGPMEVSDSRARDGRCCMLAVDI